MGKSNSANEKEVGQAGKDNLPQPNEARSRRTNNHNKRSN